MITLLYFIIITSILVLGWTIITQEGMALYSVRKWADKKHEEGFKWVDPLVRCHWCQPSLWSILGIFFALKIGLIGSIELKTAFLYVLTVGGSSLCCGLTWALYETLNRIKDKNEAEAYYFHSLFDHDETEQSSN